MKTLSVQPGLRGSNDLRVGRKMATFQFFFSRVGLRTYQHPCTRFIWKILQMLTITISETRENFWRIQSYPNSA